MLQAGQETRSLHREQSEFTMDGKRTEDHQAEGGTEAGAEGLKKSCMHIQEQEHRNISRNRNDDLPHVPPGASSCTWTKTYRKASGPMTMAKIGVVATITIMVERETKKVARNMSTVAGSASSITKMSLEKRLSTRPIGVVSKKDCGE